MTLVSHVGLSPFLGTRRGSVESSSPNATPSCMNTRRLVWGRPGQQQQDYSTSWTPPEELDGPEKLEQFISPTRAIRCGNFWTSSPTENNPHQMPCDNECCCNPAPSRVTNFDLNLSGTHYWCWLIQRTHHRWTKMAISKSPGHDNIHRGSWSTRVNELAQLFSQFLPLKAHTA